MESVWDYPRPPRVEASQQLVRVEFAGEVIAETTRAYRVLETSHPPVYYIPPEDVRSEFLRPSRRHTYCEFKGEAELLRPRRRRARGPRRRLVLPRAHVALRGDPRPHRLLPGRVDAAWVDDEQVAAQEGDFYGGWITSEIEGPFKGGPGTAGW